MKRAKASPATQRSLRKVLAELERDVPDARTLGRMGGGRAATIGNGTDVILADVTYDLISPNGNSFIDADLGRLPKEKTDDERGNDEDQKHDGRQLPQTLFSP